MMTKYSIYIFYRIADLVRELFENVQIASTEGTRLVRGYGGIVPQKIFKFGGSETLFSVLVMRYVSEKST